MWDLPAYGVQFGHLACLVKIPAMISFLRVQLKLERGSVFSQLVLYNNNSVAQEKEQGT